MTRHIQHRTYTPTGYQKGIYKQILFSPNKTILVATLFNISKAV